MKQVIGSQSIDPVFYGRRRIGPEIALEDVVVAGLSGLLPSKELPSCVFGSRLVGAGAPDLTVLYSKPNVGILAELNPASIEILAYLRVVNQARAETLLGRLGLKPKVLIGCLGALTDVGALNEDGGIFTLSPTSRHPLREIVTIETKVSKWNSALSQAARNRVFAHRSFVALPESQALLACRDPRTVQLGIGVIGVGSGGAKVLRRSRRSQPRVWRYYFELAFEVARQLA